MKLAIAELQDGRLPQRWSAETPNAAGWWWWKYNGCEEPLILPVNNQLEADHPYGWMSLELMASRFPEMRWAGPLPEPLDAPDTETEHVTFRPILDRVLCKRVAQEEKQGSIWLPDEAAERGQVFRVIAVGPGRPHHKTGRITPITVKPGDIVFSIPDMGGKKCGYPVRIGGEEFTVFEFEQEIIAIITGDGPLPVGADEL